MTQVIKLTPPIPRRPIESRVRLLVRWSRQVVRFVRAGWFDFAANSIRSMGLLVVRTVADVVRRSDVRSCNVCGWAGADFYPNCGAGYYEPTSTCPGCLLLDRHRTLVAVLASCTPFFDSATRVVEVAPMRRFEAFMGTHDRLDYTSFDLERHAMERGGITAMRFEDDSVDWFLCFHVLEHIPDEAAAMSEIHRVLRPGGTLVIQVPVDESLATTLEYGAPDPRDVGHVRRYGRDFPSIVASYGLDVTACEPATIFDPSTIQRHGLNVEAIYLGRKPLDG